METVDQQESEEAWQDLTLPMPKLFRFAAILTGISAFVTLLVFVAIWGWPFSFDSLSGLSVGSVFIRVVVFIAALWIGALIHEGLHAAGMVLFARIPPRRIRFAVVWREGIAYVTTDRPMTVRAYRIVLVLPGLFLGVIPLLYGLASGNGWVTFYGFLMLTAAAGDIAILRLLRHTSGDRLVRDHPERVGCLVYDAPLSRAWPGSDT